MGTTRMVTVVVVLVLVVGLVAFARGRTHRHGLSVGWHSGPVPVVVVPTGA